MALNSVVENAFGTVSTALGNFTGALQGADNWLEELSKATPLAGGDDWLSKLPQGQETNPTETSNTGGALPGGDNWMKQLPGQPEAEAPKGGGKGANWMAVIGEGVGYLEQFFNQIKGFVAVLSPATIDLFNQALNNVNATIGQSFLPLFADLIQVVTQANRMIAPAFEALTPVVKEFSDALSSFLLKYVRMLADQFLFLVPIIGSLLKVVEPLLQVVQLAAGVMGIFAKVGALVVELLLHFLPIGIILDALSFALEYLNGCIEAFSEVINIVMVVVQFLSKTFQTFIATLFPVTDIFKDITKAVQNAIKNLYVFSIQLAKMFGLDGVANALVDYLEKKSSAEGKTAAQQTSLKSFEQLAKDIATKSAGAGAGGLGGVDDERTFWKEVTAAAKVANAETLSFKEMVAAKMDELISKIPGVDTMRKAEAAVASATGASPATVRGAAIGALVPVPGSSFVGGLVGAAYDKIFGD